VHSERSPAAARAQGVSLWGLQFWVALPMALEGCPPAFAHTDAQAIPRVERPGAQVSVVLGEAFGARSPVALTSPMFLVDVRLEAGASIALDAAYEERAAYVVEGTVRAPGSGDAVDSGHLAWFEPGEDVALVAVDRPARLVFLGGAPLDAPRFLWWNFVSSSRDAILDAQDAWSRLDPAKFPPVPGETEHIPLPARPAPSGPAM
jgi:redox-sensitive bicupin YhaK (pirin superfamily)